MFLAGTSTAQSQSLYVMEGSIAGTKKTSCMQVLLTRAIGCCKKAKFAPGMLNLLEVRFAAGIKKICLVLTLYTQCFPEKTQAKYSAGIGTMLNLQCFSNIVNQNEGL